VIAAQKLPTTTDKTPTLLDKERIVDVDVARHRRGRATVAHQGCSPGSQLIKPRCSPALAGQSFDQIIGAWSGRPAQAQRGEH